MLDQRRRFSCLPSIRAKLSLGQPAETKQIQSKQPEKSLDQLECPPRLHRLGFGIGRTLKLPQLLGTKSIHIGDLLCQNLDGLWSPAVGGVSRFARSRNASDASAAGIR